MRYMKRVLKRILIITSIGITILSLFIINSCTSKILIGDCLPSYAGDLTVNVLELTYNVPSNSIIIRGKILDSLTLEPLIGTNVVVTSKDSKEVTGATTDIDGKFKLSFKYDPDYIIKFSYIGYKQQTFELKHFLQQYFEDQSGK